MSDYTIRRASLSEADTLTTIAFAAKRTWNYPDHYFKIWEKELTISEDYIRYNEVYVTETGQTVAGFYSLVQNPVDQSFGEVFVEKGWWLDHMFLLPQFQKMGMGTACMEHLKVVCCQKGIPVIRIFVDPFATGFYEKSDAVKIRSSRSSIPGREIPVYEINY